MLACQEMVTNDKSLIPAYHVRHPKYLQPAKISLKKSVYDGKQLDNSRRIPEKKKTNGTIQYQF